MPPRTNLRDLGPYLAIDTETTGLDFYNLPPHFDDPNSFFPTPARAFIVTACNHLGETWFVRWRVDPYTRQVLVEPADIDMLGACIDTYPTLVFHNARFDIRALTFAGIDLAPRWDDIHDTLASAHVLDSGEPHGLKPLAAKYLHIFTEDQDMMLSDVKEARAECKRRGIPRSLEVGQDYFLPFEILGRTTTDTYAVQDVIRTALLYRLHTNELQKQKLTAFYERERRVLRVTYRMESQGVHVRPRILPATLAEHTAERGSHLLSLQRISSRYGYPHLNPNSPKQLGELLHTHSLGFKLPINYLTPTKSPSIDKNAIAAYEAIAEDIQETGRIRESWRNIGFTSARRRLDRDEKARWKDVSDFYSTLLDYRAHATATSYLTSYVNYATNHDNSLVIHPSFNPWGTSTTRFSSSEPNAQNIGKAARVPLRKVFGPRKNHLWFCFDYNQLELRLMAKASGDPTLTRVLAEGQDRHQITADALNVSRKQAKNINFAWQYGAGDEKLSIMAGMDAATFNNAMRTAYPGVVDFAEKTDAQIRHRYKTEGFGYVRTLFGYRLAVSINKTYAGVNYIIQGTAGDILKNAMLDIDSYLTIADLHTKIAIVLSIHDELVLEVHRSVPLEIIEDLDDIMSSQGDPIGCHVPVNVTSTRTHWAAAKPVKF